MVIHIFIAAAAGGIYEHLKEKKQKKRIRNQYNSSKSSKSSKSNNINPNGLITLNNLTMQQLKQLENHRKKPTKIKRFFKKLEKSIRPFIKPAIGVIVFGCICVSTGIPIAFNINLIGASGSLSTCVWYFDNKKSSNKKRICNVSNKNKVIKDNSNNMTNDVNEDMINDVKEDMINDVKEDMTNDLKDISNNLNNYFNNKESSIDKLYNEFFPNNNKIEDSFEESFEESFTNNSFEYDYNTDFLKKMKKNSGYYDISSRRPGLRLSNDDFTLDVRNNGIKYNSNVNLNDNIGIGKEIGIYTDNIFTGISVLSNDERTTCGFGIDSPNSINNEIFYYCSKHKKLDAPRLATVKIYNARRDINVNVLGYTGSHRGELVLKGDELQYTERIGVSYNMLSNFGGAFVYKALGKQILKTGIYRASVLVGVR